MLVDIAPWGRISLGIFSMSLLLAISAVYSNFGLDANLQASTLATVAISLIPFRPPYLGETCQSSDPQVIVYNRIPKAGSTTLISLLTKLAEENGYALVLPVPYYDHAAARDAVLSALQTGQKTVICNHFNFPELIYSDQVAYVNVMRDPVDRCASFYYYTRYGDRQRELKSETIEMYGNGTLDECASKPFEELESCLNCNPATQALAFCGREGGPCADAAPDAVLRQAWDNIRSHYFVGVTEDLSGTVDVLEARFPTFFQGMSKLLAETKPQKVSSTREEYVAPNEETREIVAKWAAVDVELYRRVQERYNRQLQACSTRRRT